jgi:hypothetical protein
MQAKDIADEPILRFLASLGQQTGTWYFGIDADNSIERVCAPGTPPKVALAKMRSMIKRGLVDGCVCGCRGGFTLTAKGDGVLNGNGNE